MLSHTELFYINHRIYRLEQENLGLDASNRFEAKRIALNRRKINSLLNKVAEDLSRKQASNCLRIVR